MRAARNDRGVLQLKFVKFLLAYRETPHCTIGVSPTDSTLIWTRLDLLRATVESSVLQKQVDYDSYSKLVNELLILGNLCW